MDHERARLRALVCLRVVSIISQQSESRSCEGAGEGDKDDYIITVVARFMRTLVRMTLYIVVGEGVFLQQDWGMMFLCLLMLLVAEAVVCFLGGKAGSE